METLNMSSLIIIFFVALGTYSLRVSGLLLSSRFLQEGRVKVFLDYLPATLLLSLVAPAILKEGFLGLIATLAIAFIMLKSKNILLSMLAGIIIVAVGRSFYM